MHAIASPVIHGLRIVAVIQLAADTVIDHERKVDAFIWEVIGKAPEQFWNGIAQIFLLAVACHLIIIFGFYPFLHDFFSFVVCFVNRFPILVVSGFRVHTCILDSPEIIAGFTFTPFEDTGIDFGLRQLGYTVLIRCPVQIDGPFKIFIGYGSIIQREFDTLVLNVTDITVNTAHAGRRSHRQCKQQVFRLTAEPLDTTAQLIEHGKIQTDIELQIRLPFQILVWQTADHNTRIPVVVHACRIQTLISIISPQVIITDSTIAGFQFQIIQPGTIRFHKFFIGYSPWTT